MNPSLTTELVAATAEALDRWEPRLKLEQVNIEGVGVDGKIELSLVGVYLIDGRTITMEGLVL